MGESKAIESGAIDCNHEPMKDIYCFKLARIVILIAPSVLMPSFYFLSYKLSVLEQTTLETSQQLPIKISIPTTLFRMAPLTKSEKTEGDGNEHVPGPATGMSASKEESTMKDTIDRPTAEKEKAQAQHSSLQKDGSSSTNPDLNIAPADTHEPANTKSKKGEFSRD